MGKREELMVTLEEAGEQLWQIAEKLKQAYTAVEEVPLWEAGGRIIAEEVVAADNVPPFNRSLVDGFALRSADTKTGTPPPSPLDTVAAGVAGKGSFAFTACKILQGTFAQVVCRY